MQGFLNAVTGIANESGFVGIMENPGSVSYTHLRAHET